MGRELDMDKWEPPREHSEEDPELYREIIFYEPPYSIWQATVGVIVIAVSGLLYLWLWGD
ncbi:MAG TPA: hypothetical protein VNY77_03140 [Candidatus Angelobacter sp.]|nr:hypothetical protein [Candidatus Angelobacter sp.]